MEKIHYKRFILVKDNFYTQPDKVYHVALNADYYEPSGATGFRSREVYHPPGVKKQLEQILGIKINRWDTDPLDENGVFYQGFSKGNKREIPGVHSDEPYNDITILIYLTPGLPCNCGTSLWMHTETKLCDPVTKVSALKLKRRPVSLQRQLERESKVRTKWTEIDRIGYRFNRMVAYPSGVFHSATNHYGGSNRDGRLYQTYRIGVDWKSFRLAKA